MVQGAAVPAMVGVVLQQPAGIHMAGHGQQAWFQGPAPGGGNVSYRSAAVGPQAPIAVYQQQQPQQVRMATVPVSAAQLSQAQQMLLSGPLMGAPRQAAPQAVVISAPPGTAANASQQQLVYVNINGSVQRGVVHNGAVYLLANDNGAAVAGAGAQPVAHGTAIHQGGGQVGGGLQQQPRPGPQQVVMQHVMTPGQTLVPFSAAVVASRAGVQLPVSQQLQARPVPHTQPQPVILMAPGTGPNNLTAGGAGINIQARPQQQRVMLQMPQAPRPAAGQTGGPLRQAANSGVQAHMPANSVSANTASLMPRMAASSGTTTAPHGARLPATPGQPMTIAAALAALPSNPAPAGTQAMPSASSELSSPVAPPGTPGMGNAMSGMTAGTIGAVIHKLGAPAAASAGDQVLAGPGPVRHGAFPGGRNSVTPTGSSPLTSQPGTPSRSNSMGANSTNSSTSGASCSSSLLGAAEAVPPAGSGDDGKMAVMRMFARTFVETGIGLEQALGMIQPSDREMLGAAFAAEAAAALNSSPAAMVQVTLEGASGYVACKGGVAELGGEQISLPAAEGRTSGPSGLQQLANLAGGASSEGVHDLASGLDATSFGSWGFSLFSNVASDFGSNQGGSSFGGIGDMSGIESAAGASSSAATDDVSTATLFANLNL